MNWQIKLSTHEIPFKKFLSENIILHNGSPHKTANKGRGEKQHKTRSRSTITKILSNKAGLYLYYIPVDVGRYQNQWHDRRLCTVASLPMCTPPGIPWQTSQTSQELPLPVNITNTVKIYSESLIFYHLFLKLCR